MFMDHEPYRLHEVDVPCYDDFGGYVGTVIRANVCFYEEEPGWWVLATVFPDDSIWMTGRLHYQAAPWAPRYDQTVRHQAGPRSLEGESMKPAPTTGEALRLRHMIEMIRVHPGSDLTNAWELVKLHGGAKPNGLLYSQAQLEAKATRELTSIAARIEWANLAKEMG